MAGDLVEVRFKGIPPLTPFLQSAMSTALEAVRAATVARVSPRKLGARAGIPRKPGYGPLRNEFAATITPLKRGGLRGTVGTPTYYARFLERGAVAHFIAPKDEEIRGLPILQSGGGVHFRRFAHHPGIRARYFMRDAALATFPGVPALFEVAVQQWAQATAVGPS